VTYFALWAENDISLILIFEVLFAATKASKMIRLVTHPSMIAARVYMALPPGVYALARALRAHDHRRGESLQYYGYWIRVRIYLVSVAYTGLPVAAA